jgi:hypothetical protein
MMHITPENQCLMIVGFVDIIIVMKTYPNNTLAMMQMPLTTYTDRWIGWLG